MWTYIQSTGRLLDAKGQFVARGYSGAGAGKDNPAAESVRLEGPIPTGYYAIERPVDTLTHGPYYLPLLPDAGNQMHGRAGFGIHGDSLRDPGSASEGCIIVPKWVRRQIWESGDHRLQVIASYPLEVKV